MAGMLRLSEGDLPCMISAPHARRSTAHRRWDGQRSLWLFRR
jgi:hypothetical protein